MPVAVPVFADVRPRVVIKGTREPLLLEEVLPGIVDEFPAGLVIAITGPVGSGKTTALAHAAAALAHRDDVIFLDEPSPKELETRRSDVTVVATMPQCGLGIEMALEPWRQDELIEYLLARHHDQCGSVIRRLGSAANWTWAPQLASIVLDRFAANEALGDPSEALLQYVDEWLTDASLKAHAEHACVTLLTAGEKEIQAAVDRLLVAKCPLQVRKFLMHDRVRLPLAARRLVTNISRGVFDELNRQLPYDLVEFVGRTCRRESQATERLRDYVGSKITALSQSMAASILVVADPAWRPSKPRRPVYFTGGMFPNVHWSKVNLFHASLANCDFSDADLFGATLDDALANGAGFQGANLRRASMLRIFATRAGFQRANLHRARLAGARLEEADFTEANLAGASLMKADLCRANLSAALLTGADLTEAKLNGAKLRDADLSGAVFRSCELVNTDLRHVRLEGACFENANLTQAQLEDVQMPQAKMRSACLRSAHLTGSSMPGADLQGANLKSAGLAEIEWENADLRRANLSGATFHMGSSRSGLVGSPIACEGSRTGFYTDDFEDMTFKRPDEVRKANLRGADLRGATARSVDFYLVDLRDAKLDPLLFVQARQTGAILDDLVR